MAGSGGRHHSLATRIVAKQEFAGYWEYVLDEAIFTAPAHPFWGGGALIDSAGSLIGIGSLQVEQRAQAGDAGQLNMIVPIDLLKPILGDLLTTGSTGRPPRAWLGLFATDLEGKVFIVGVYSGRAGRPGRPQARRPHRLGRRRAGVEPRRFLPKSLVARTGRRRSAARRPARGRARRGAHHVERPRQVSEEAADAFVSRC